MVSVAWAIGLSFTARWAPTGAERAQLRVKTSRRKVPIGCVPCIQCSKRRANLQGYLTPLWLRYCMAIGAGRGSDDVDDVSGLSEPHGPDGSMAERGRVGAEISQSRSARCLRPAIRTARRRAGADLAHLADLYPPVLRHRQGAGRQPGTGGGRGGHLRHPVRLAAAFQEEKF